MEEGEEEGVEIREREGRIRRKGGGMETLRELLGCLEELEIPGNISSTHLVWNM